MQLGLGDRAKRIIMIATIVIGVVCLGWRVKWTVDAYSQYKADLASCDSAIVKTQTDIQAQRQELTDVNQEKQEVLANYHELGEAGIRVAQLQNEWSTYVYQLSICQDGEKESYRQEIYDTEQKMKDYFSDVPFGWFAWKDRNVAWSCVTNYSFYTNTLRTVWICQWADAKTTQLRLDYPIYAYATADYSYDTRKFSNIDVRISGQGNRIRVEPDLIAEYNVKYPSGDFPTVDSDCKLYYPIGTGVFDTHVKSAEEDPSRRPAETDPGQTGQQPGTSQDPGTVPGGEGQDPGTSQDLGTGSEPGTDPGTGGDPGTGSQDPGTETEPGTDPGADPGTEPSGDPGGGSGRTLFD